MLRHIYFLTNIIFNHLILIQKCSFLWQLHYLATELPYFEYNLWKILLILVWWKLKIAYFQKIIFVTTFFGHCDVLSSILKDIWRKLDNKRKRKIILIIEKISAKIFSNIIFLVLCRIMKCDIKHNHKCNKLEWCKSPYLSIDEKNIMGPNWHEN